MKLTNKSGTYTKETESPREIVNLKARGYTEVEDAPAPAPTPVVIETPKPIENPFEEASDVFEARLENYLNEQE